MMNDNSRPPEQAGETQPADPVTKNSVGDATSRGNVLSEEDDASELAAPEAHPS